MLTNRAVTTHFLPFFFCHTYTPARGCASYEEEGVGATDHRVWHMRTFPGATDVRPTHLPHPTQVDQWLWPLCRALVLGTSLCKMMNKHECTKCKNVY